MKGYKVDFAKEIVTVTKKFMDDAGVIGSAAFKEMMTLRKLGFAIVEREVKARKVNTITYAQMIQYMSLVENSNKYMATFNAMRAEAGSKNDRYNRVLKWFRATFPDFYAMPEFNEKNEIIVNKASGVSGTVSEETMITQLPVELKTAV